MPVAKFKYVKNVTGNFVETKYKNKGTNCTIVTLTQ